MSVRKGDRAEGKLQVLNAVRELCAYTLIICRSEKAIPKSQRWIMAQRIVGEAIEAATCISKANGYPLTDIVGSFLRYIKQVEARGHIKSLLTLIQLSYEVFGIEAGSVKHWTELAVNADRLLRAWVRSDRGRSAFLNTDILFALYQILARFFQQRHQP